MKIVEDLNRIDIFNEPDKDRWVASLELSFGTWDAWDEDDILFHAFKGTREQAIQEMINKLSLKRLQS